MMRASGLSAHWPVKKAGASPSRGIWPFEPWKKPGSGKAYQKRHAFSYAVSNRHDGLSIRKNALDF